MLLLGLRREVEGRLTRKVKGRLSRNTKRRLSRNMKGRNGMMIHGMKVRKRSVGRMKTKRSRLNRRNS